MPTLKETSFLKTFISEDFRPLIQGGRLDESHHSHFILREDYSYETAPWLRIKALCFGPKQDKVLLNLEHALSASDGVLVLYYEDLHSQWSYVMTSEDAYFIFQKNEQECFRVKPNCLYIRGCQVPMEDSRWMLLGEFYNFIDSWEGKVLCAPSSQHNNESKLYQLNQSLKLAANNKPSVSIGHSYVVKGQECFKQLSPNKSYIVKSLSGIRSRVVDEAHYNEWSLKNLENLPVLFQEKVAGNDLRIHVLNSNLYGKFSVEKEAVDYRYDDNFFSLEDYDNFTEELQAFCIDASLLEENQLLGIDFIKSKDGYVVLEANPSPGWSAYYPCNGIETPPFIKDLIHLLTTC